MIIKDLQFSTKMYGKIDAMLIVNKDCIIEYSAMITDESKQLRAENIIGRNLFDAYPDLEYEKSSHVRVMKSGKPILNELQTLTDLNGRTIQLINSTFPIIHDEKVIGTMDVSVFPNKVKIDECHKLFEIDDIITKNKQMLKIKEKILKSALTNSAVLIYGDSGTGKELVAQSLHTSSNRASKPFMSLNCAAVPENLLESTVFGTVKGSFTGAENKKGIFEIADGGTIFFDEINSMNIELQAKILKAIEEKRYMKVGGEKYLSTDVRIISAMNINPFDAIKNGKLRKDLFYRLGVVQIEIPPLEKRKEDISELVSYFIKVFNNEMDKNITGIDGIVADILYDYSWPGNVRELKNVIESAFNLSMGGIIKVSDLPEYLLLTNMKDMEQVIEIDEDLNLNQMVDNFEKDIIIRTLKNSKNVTIAAKKLKITRQSLQYKIDKYNL
ncbi:sigma-54 interaction domain-containing protein [Anaerovorax sp. IOR16]|uniref:sigma-54 interaction domain-containing protein n=1 Tax=Anaerovorax sp. IOR16 TaxID=2773458 RepID=UPI0019D1FD9B|nr:sigma 54-interacting transcriptional regulator [Anaerovorax sp. IOR16]